MLTMPANRFSFWGFVPQAPCQEFAPGPIGGTQTVWVLPQMNIPLFLVSPLMSFIPVTDLSARQQCIVQSSLGSFCKLFLGVQLFNTGPVSRLMYGVKRLAVCT